MTVADAGATSAPRSEAAVDGFLTAEDALLREHGLAARKRYVDLAEPRLRVRVLEIGEGPPVLLLPGLGAVAATWAPLLAGLNGVRSIALDRPGCGLSDGVSFTRLDLRRWSVGLVSALIDALQLDRVSIVGNSIGGTMALWYTIDHPQRVDRLVLIGAPPFVLDAQAPLGMRLMAIPFIARRALSRSTPADIDAAFVRMGHPAGVLTPQLLELGTTARRLPGYADGFVGLLGSATGLTGRRVSAPAGELAEVACPTLLIWGSNDTHGPVATGRGMVATMPNARLEVRGQGHLPWLDDPAGCASITRDFLLGG